MARRIYTERQILDVLRMAAVREGGPVSTSQWRARGMKPSYTVIRSRLGSWEEAWNRAGFPPLAKNAKRTRAAEDRRRRASRLAFHALERAARRVGRPLTQREWDERRYRPKARMVAAHFGSWKEAWEAVGFLDPGRPSRLPDKEILSSLKRAALRFGGPISCRRWTQAGLEPAPSTVVRRFGSWAEAWSQAVGKRPSSRPGRKNPLTPFVQNQPPAGITLTDREMQILAGVRRGETFAVIGGRLGLSRERVRQLGIDIRRRALREISGGGSALGD